MGAQMDYEYDYYDYDYDYRDPRDGLVEERFVRRWGYPEGTERQPIGHHVRYIEIETMGAQMDYDYSVATHRVPRGNP